MTYEIEFWKKSLYRGCYPFVKNIKTREEAKVEFSDLVAIGSPVRYRGLRHYCDSDKTLDVIVQGMPEDANAFFRINFYPLNDPHNETVIQYYQVNECFHSVSNLP